MTLIKSISDILETNVGAHDKGLSHLDVVKYVVVCAGFAKVLNHCQAITFVLDCHLGISGHKEPIPKLLAGFIQRPFSSRQQNKLPRISE